MFDQGEVNHRNKYFHRTLAHASLVLASSENSKRQIARHWPKNVGKVQVFPFRAKISWQEVRTAVAQHARPDYKFFLCPYQLWKHKNHRILLSAAQECVRRGNQLKILCTGEPNDFRHPTYPADLMRQVREAGLSETIVFVGRIPRERLLSLMVQAEAILFPSLCEGWSTGLEEAKALGKACIVSDIAIHREQDHPVGRYFDPESPTELANLLTASYPDADLNRVEKSLANYHECRIRSGERFLSFLKNLC